MFTPEWLCRNHSWDERILWKKCLFIEHGNNILYQRKHDCIGGGTEIAVIALGGIVCDKSVPGDVFTYSTYTHYTTLFGESTAEK
jgi:hypothetical protein